MAKLRTVFMGSPEFAVPTLRAVLDATDVVAVVTQPDKPAGRGQKVLAPAVKVLAEERGIRVLQPKSARTGELETELRALAPDVAVVVAYGKILPQAVLDVPRLGCLNVHGSLLPKYRGAAPIQWALINGEAETGITIMKLDAGMDTGPMLMWRTLKISDEDTSGSLAVRLAGIGAELMVVALERLQAGKLPEIPQDASKASMAPMLEKDTGKIDWAKPARAVRDLVRGVDPWPGAFTTLGGEVVKVWGARVIEGSGTAGQVLGADRDGLIVACGDGAVALGELQLAGKKRLPAQAFLAGKPVAPGTVLGA
jgi:methionyl-tRNA formyltransferase